MKWLCRRNASRHCTVRHQPETHEAGGPHDRGRLVAQITTTAVYLLETQDVVVKRLRDALEVAKVADRQGRRGRGGAVAGKGAGSPAVERTRSRISVRSDRW
jgi:hypothetical protein